MRNAWLLSGVFLGCAMSAGLALQAQSQTTTAQGMLTVTGCIRMGSVGAPGSTTSTPTTNSSSSGYILTDARMSPVAGSGTSSSTTSPNGSSSSSNSTASTSSATTAASTFMLEGQDKQLSDQVGHQVEVTGRLATPASSAVAGTQRLDVQSVRMISASCSR